MREDPRFPGALIHISSYVDDDAILGRGTKIWHFCHILPGAVIGENCSIGQNVMIGPRVKVGNGCKIQNNVSLYDGVELADDVFCGPSCVFTNVNNPRSHVSRKDEFRPNAGGQGRKHRSERHHRVRAFAGRLLLYRCGRGGNERCSCIRAVDRKSRPSRGLDEPGR